MSARYSKGIEGLGELRVPLFDANNSMAVLPADRFRGGFLIHFTGPHFDPLRAPRLQFDGIPGSRLSLFILFCKGLKFP